MVSGPNGSGKSNILDALLFCLGLSTSKGMRAERLPDLVNQNHNNHRGTAETSVSVTFDLSELEHSGNGGNGSSHSGNGGTHSGNGAGTSLTDATSLSPITDLNSLSSELDNPKSKIHLRSSDDSLNPKSIGANYDVTIQPESLKLSSSGRECPIQSGMEGRADIISREETVLRFILRKARLLTDL